MPKEIDIPVIPTAVGAALGYWIGKSTSLGSTLGMIAGGFGGYFIGKKTPQMAKVHFQNPKKNPNKKWHLNRAEDLDREVIVHANRGHRRLATETELLAAENRWAASESKSNPTRTQLRKIMQEAARLRKSGMHKQGALRNAWREFGQKR